MKDREVEIGRIYIVNVSGREVPVRIQDESLVTYRRGRQFSGKNLLTGRLIRTSARRCRRLATEADSLWSTQNE